MAKKKTENIKAAPVLRAQGNEQPTPTPEQTGTRTYQIMDPWKDRGAVNLVDVKAVDGEITEVKVNGVPAGGGGGGGTATVSITNASSNTPFELSLPIIDGESNQSWGGNVAVFPGPTKTCIVPLGPSGCYAKFSGMGGTPSSGTGTGGVTYNAGSVIITGDGTLTVS